MEVIHAKKYSTVTSKMKLIFTPYLFINLERSFFMESSSSLCYCAGHKLYTVLFYQLFLLLALAKKTLFLRETKSTNNLSFFGRFI